MQKKEKAEEGRKKVRGGGDGEFAHVCLGDLFGLRDDLGRKEGRQKGRKEGRQTGKFMYMCMCMCVCARM